ncbi:MAG: V-type ATP synthase subunit D [Promethearchaeota archaeon]|nr:MAG: V-type ATP synthase subunit D [Candidatus Lokiarchaeota archaeon]
MSFRKVKPTKSNLLRLEERLEFVDKGKDFLNYKREQLIREIRNLWVEYKSQKRTYYKVLAKVMLKLNDTYKTMGKGNFVIASKMSQIQYKPGANISFLKKIGLVIPKIDLNLDRGDKLPSYSFENTSKDLDELTDILPEFVENLVLLAETEDVLIKFGENFKKINRRINGLKNVTEPKLKEQIKKIEKILEDNERENLVRLKKTKELIENKK